MGIRDINFDKNLLVNNLVSCVACSGNRDNNPDSWLGAVVSYQQQLWE